MEAFEQPNAIGSDDDDILHAFHHPTRISVLEVGFAIAEGVEFIVHAMPARAKFLR